jgi:hypothetical protein
MNAPNLLALPVARVEHVEDAPDEDHDAADDPRLRAGQDRPDGGDRESDQRQPIGCQADPAHGERDRLEDLLDGPTGFVRDGHRVSPPRPGSRARALRTR